MNKSPQVKNLGRIIAMALIGLGLLLVGIAALAMLPDADAAVKRPVAAASVIPAKVNFLAPSLELTDLQGNPVSLENFAGKVVLVNNWATWCPPCKAEMPILQEYYQTHKEEDFLIVAIEAGSPVPAVQAFARQYDLAFPVWPDPGEIALDAFQNDYLPNSYVIDRTGQVRLAWTGAITLEMLEKYITPLLEE